MRSVKLLLTILTIFSLSMLVRCSKDGPTTAGNGSKEGNAMIRGKLFNKDNTPAVNATIILRKKNTLADTSSALHKTFADTVSAVTTTDSGTFSIDSVAAGLYVIEGTKNSDLVLIDSIVVKNPDSTVLLPPDTLKPAGAIKGVIRLSEGGDPRKVFVLAFGIDRFARVNVGGSFKFNTLAEGKYDLRLISSLDNYGVLDTVNISVISADTTDLDTIDLPFTGIPTPKNVTINYDTLKQIVALSWGKADPTLVNGYYVYRRNVDSNSILARINTSPITDTLYRDSTGIQDQTYEYRVSAIDKNVTEGTKSVGVRVKVVGAFSLVDSLGSYGTAAGQFTDIWDMTFDNKQTFYVVSCENTTGNNPKVQKFDLNKNSIFSFGSKGTDSLQFQQPKGIAVDQRQWIYVTDRENARIQTFDSTGAFVQSIHGQVSDNSQLLYPKEIAVDDSAIYVGDYSNSEYFSTVKKFDLKGNFIQKWGTKGNGAGQFIMIWAMKITSKGELAILDENGIQLFSKQGVFLKKINTKLYGLVQDFDINGNDFYLSAWEGKIIKLDESGNFVGKFDTGKTDLFQIASNGSKIFLNYFESGSIKIFQQK